MPISQEVNMLYRHFLVSVRWGIKNTINFHFPQPTNLPRIVQFNKWQNKIQTSRSSNLQCLQLPDQMVLWWNQVFIIQQHFYHEGLIFKSSRTCDCALYLYHREIKMIFGFGRWKSLTFSVTIIQCNFSSLSATQLIGL